MAPRATGSLGETASIVAVWEMTTAFKFIVAVATSRKATKNFTTDGKTYPPPRGIDFDAIDGSDSREAFV